VHPLAVHPLASAGAATVTDPIVYIIGLGVYVAIKAAVRYTCITYITENPKRWKQFTPQRENP